MGSAAFWLLPCYRAPVGTRKLLGKGRHLGGSDCLIRGAVGDAMAALTWLGSPICSSVTNGAMLMHVALQLGLMALSQLILRKYERVHCELLLDSDFWNGKLILLDSFTCRYLNTMKKSVCLLQLACFFFFSHVWPCSCCFVQCPWA